MATQTMLHLERLALIEGADIDLSAAFDIVAFPAPDPIFRIAPWLCLIAIEFFLGEHGLS